MFSDGSFATRPLLPWPNPWSPTWVSAVVAAGVALSGIGSPFLLLALAVVAGLPHGAADLSEGRRAFGSFRTWWWLPFLTGYFGLIGIVLTMWWLCPSVMLAAFLSLSAIHFGAQDEHAGKRGWPCILAHGGAPIVVPALFYGGAVMHLFAILACDHAGSIKAMIAGPLAIAWLVAVALTLAKEWRSAEQPRVRSADLLLTILLFAFATPLVAFAVYFALMHTPRALVAQRNQAGETLSLKRIITLTALACVLGTGIFSTKLALSLNTNIVRTAFMLLAALTVPHMALDYLQLRRNLTSLRGRSVGERVPAVSMLSDQERA